MNLELSAGDIALRLALSVVGGAIIGFNRGIEGRPAGLRTTLLACLAAAISMILTNQLLQVTGKTPDSFSVMDVMRLPLGVLSGMGFIGGGAILRKGDMVVGVTTAATLWFVTMMGLCFGAGSIGLGLAALGLGIATLWLLKWVEAWMRQERQAQLALTLADPDVDIPALQDRLEAAGFRIAALTVQHAMDPPRSTLRFDLRWTDRIADKAPPPKIRDLRDLPGLVGLEWRCQ
jgi:putative Mg2+ transporter-C (MgtC) family protein